MKCVICGKPAAQDSICDACDKDFDKVALARREVMRRNQCPTCGAPLVQGASRAAIQKEIRDRLFVPGPVINRDGSVEYNEQDAVGMLREARAKTQEGKAK